MALCPALLKCVRERGKGLGRAFINAGLAFGQEHFSVGVWSLSVATFNTRAIRLYEHVGFTPLTTFLQHTNGGEYEFLRMVRKVAMSVISITQSAGEPFHVGIYMYH